MSHNSKRIVDYTTLMGTSIMFALQHSLLKDGTCNWVPAVLTARRNAFCTKAPWSSRTTNHNVGH